VNRRNFIALMGSAVAAGPVAARAQDAGRKHLIGFLGNSTAALEANLVGPFRDELRALGYEEGRNLTIEYRWAVGMSVSPP
jgi:putative ABC transport system substrate-binding protein